ncbi:MAG TPA: ferritin-like domain-containing protein [Bacteroidota bacterium]|nr:ferritin-like domain-containing protein [Bacteroidota bacterium]
MKHTRTNNSRASMRTKSPSLKRDVENLRKLYEEDLKDIYWAEKHLMKALQKMVKASSSDELKRAFENHMDRTKTQITRLEKVFHASDLKVAGKRCEGIEGITKEAEDVIEEFNKGSVCDAGLIIAAQKAEHYEIASYGSLRSLAHTLEFEEASKLLQETLEEEGEADKMLTTLSEKINTQAYSQSEMPSM